MLNWTRLVTQGRAKDIGIAWNEKEQEAIAALIEHTGMERVAVAAYVREGILTAKDYDAAQKSGNKPTGREELEARATELGIEFDGAATDTTLKKVIADAEKAAEAAKAEAEKAAKADKKK